MDERISRLKQVEDLYKFFDGLHDQLKKILGTLEWSEESLFSKRMVQCPLNNEHWISESSLNKHIESCTYRTEDYTTEEMEKLPPSSKFFYSATDSVTSVTLDPQLLTKILSESAQSEGQSVSSHRQVVKIPRSMERFMEEFSPQERLAIYEYVISQEKTANKPTSVTVEDLILDFEKKKNENENRPKTKLEILAEQRDYKRRRQSYRAKNVHITKKSYTEVMKEVIENQITYLTETQKQEEFTSDTKFDENVGTSQGCNSYSNEKEVPDLTETKKHSSKRRDSSEHRYRHHHHKHKHSRSHSKERKRHKSEHKKHSK